MSTFGFQDDAESLPVAQRRELDREAAAQRRTHWLIALAVALPVLAAVGLLACLAALVLRGPGSAPVDTEPPAAQAEPAAPLSPEDRRRLAREKAEAVEEEKEREIRERIDRALETKRRDEERRAARWLPPASDQSNYEDD